MNDSERLLYSKMHKNGHPRSSDFFSVNWQWSRQEFLLGGNKCQGLGRNPRKFLFDHALYFGYKRNQL